MKTSFLITTVTAALLAGTSLSSAQNNAADPKQDQKAAPSVQMKSQDRVQTNAQEKAGQAAKDKTANDKAAQDKAKDNAKAAQQPAQAPSTTGQGMTQPDSRRQPNAAPQAPASQQPKATQGQGSSAQTQSQAQGQANGSAVTLTEQQKTTIRQSVLGAHGSPKQANVNFSLNVGTEVPQTVHLVAVPEPLFRVHSAWRGQMYFIVGDEIIVVDRATHRIIAVIMV